jgi:hypothetical protein
MERDEDVPECHLMVETIIRVGKQNVEGAFPSLVFIGRVIAWFLAHVKFINC